MSRPFRFGFQLSGEHEADPIAAARRAEELGFDVVLVSDHIGPGLAPMTTLAAIATATDRIRLGTFVLNNDMRNPHPTRLGGGVARPVVGRPLTRPRRGPYAAGVRDDRDPDGPAAARKAVSSSRCGSSDPSSAASGYGTVGRPVQERVPLLVGGNGASLLGAAGELADIIGLQGLGRTLEAVIVTR